MRVMRLIINNSYCHLTQKFISLCFKPPILQNSCCYCSGKNIEQDTGSLFKASPVNIGYDATKYERKAHGRRIKEVYQTGDKEKHIYKQNYNSIKNKIDLANYLKNKEIHTDKKNYLCFNKPYGLKRYSDQVEAKNSTRSTSKTKLKTTNSSSSSAELNLQDALPILKKLYNLKHLEVVKNSERWTSGVLVMCTNDKSVPYIKKCLRRAIQHPSLTYKVITLGKPVPETFDGRVGNTLQYVGNETKVPVIKPTFSKNDVANGKVSVHRVKHEVVAYNEEFDTSLVKIVVTNTENHFLRCWMTHCYSPILGDALYGNRVKTILGKKVKIKPALIRGYQPQEISPEVLKRLQLRKGLTDVIPTHSHFSDLEIIDKSGNFTFSAPYSESFAWTMQQLGLEEEKETLVIRENCEEISS